MSSLFAITPITPDPSLSASALDQMLALAEPIKGVRNTNRVQSAWAAAATAPRLNGSGSAVTTDPKTGNWIAIAGTCFHRSGVTDSDPAALLSRWQAQGSQNFARDLEGFFVILIGDASSQELIAITDIVGSCHAYSRQTEDGTFVSTSSAVLAALGDASLDPVATQEFLATGVIYEDRSLYRDVTKLPPASISHYQSGRLIAREIYWDIAQLKPESITGQEAVEQLWHSTSLAAARIMSHFPRVACDLTGGYDSRALFAAFLGTKANFTTVVTGPEHSGDVRISRELAAKFGKEHLHIRKTLPASRDDLTSAVSLTEGEYDSVEYFSTYRVHSELASNFAVSINGSFGEVARGYWWELLMPHMGQARRLPTEVVATRRYNTGSPANLMKPEDRLDLRDHFTAALDRSIAGLESAPNTFQLDATYLRMRMHRWQGRIASNTNQIWPCLSPFMFRSVLEVMLQARFKSRSNSMLVRRMLARYQPALAAHPLEHGYPAAPVSVRTLPLFWPIVPYFAKRAWGKAKRTITRTPYVASSVPELPFRSELNRLLNPKEMQTARLLHEDALAQFLQSSRQPGFAHQQQFNRLLTIELALSKIGDAQRRTSAFGAAR